MVDASFRDGKAELNTDYLKGRTNDLISEMSGEVRRNYYDCCTHPFVQVKYSFTITHTDDSMFS